MHRPRFLVLTLAGLTAMSACDAFTPAPSTCEPEFDLAAATADPAPAASGRTDAAPHTLAVTGTGVVFAAPDIVTAQIGIQTRGNDVGSTIADNSAALTRVTAALAALGVDETDIQPGSFSTSPQGEYDPETGQLREPIIHVVDSVVGVTLRDPQQLGEALRRALAAGATVIHGAAYGVDDPHAPAAQARDLALADARARAEQIARAAGVALGQPIGITESPSGSGPFSQEQAMMGLSPFGARPHQVVHHVTVTYAIR